MHVMWRQLDYCSTGSDASYFISMETHSNLRMGCNVSEVASLGRGDLDAVKSLKDGSIDDFF